MALISAGKEVQKMYSSNLLKSIKEVISAKRKRSLNVKLLFYKMLSVIVFLVAVLLSVLLFMRRMEVAEAIYVDIETTIMQSDEVVLGGTTSKTTLLVTHHVMEQEDTSTIVTTAITKATRATSTTTSTTATKTKATTTTSSTETTESVDEEETEFEETTVIEETVEEPKVEDDAGFVEKSPKAIPDVLDSFQLADSWLTSFGGVHYWNSSDCGEIKETYYNCTLDGVFRLFSDEIGYSYEQVQVRSDGVWCIAIGESESDWLVCVAADLYQFPRGSIVRTSLGYGIVCDTGGFTSWEHGSRWFDIAVSWGPNGTEAIF